MRVVVDAISHAQVSCTVGQPTFVPEEGCATGLYELAVELQVLLDLINNTAAARVDANVVKGCCEVWDVGFYRLFAQGFARNHVERKQQLL